MSLIFGDFRTFEILRKLFKFLVISSFGTTPEIEQDQARFLSCAARKPEQP